MTWGINFKRSVRRHMQTADLQFHFTGLGNNARSPFVKNSSDFGHIETPCCSVEEVRAQVVLKPSNSLSDS